MHWCFLYSLWRTMWFLGKVFFGTLHLFLKFKPTSQHTKLRPHECTHFHESTKIGPHENEWFHRKQATCCLSTNKCVHEVPKYYDVEGRQTPRISHRFYFEPWCEWEESTYMLLREKRDVIWCIPMTYTLNDRQYIGKVTQRRHKTLDYTAFMDRLGWAFRGTTVILPVLLS